MFMTASVVVRTYNEARYLPDLLKSIRAQSCRDLATEVVVVDSGSTDDTLDIARAFDCKIVPIEKEKFSFGRSLNVGCDAASGEYLVFVSGHCVPAISAWLQNLVDPLVGETAAYAYGRQIGGRDSKFSEHQLFEKFFPGQSKLPQDGFFCNNANAALRKDVWREHQFDEDLTGLEDMELGKRLVTAGMQVGYVAEAPVYHYHHETWPKVRLRYEREAIALQHILPEVHLSLRDFLRYFTSALLLDSGEAIEQRRFLKACPEIFLFRLMQFWGSYRGNHEHRKLSREQKERYFYPK
jgi:glycosyltransferase involved in cell wall biosynthesis